MQQNSGGKSTKELILKASMELFSEYGYKAASVRKIAAKVGIRESALYNHFTNKEEILPRHPLRKAKEVSQSVPKTARSSSSHL